jgi:outer membrane lipoprotein-sorting protein
MKNRLLLTAGLLLAGLPSASGAADSREIIENVRKLLTEKVTVTARFEEQFLWQMVGENQTIRGEFELKGDTRFRITTEDQVIVSDGKTLWTYSKTAKRLLIDQMENTDNQWLPQSLFLKTQKDYRHRVTGEEEVLGRKCVIVTFDAVKDDSYFPKMKVWVDAETSVPARIEQVDISKNRTVYTLSEVRMGVPIEDSSFQFKAPDDTEVIDLR